jgi:hypothetical protein
MDSYEFERYIATTDTVKQVLEQYGVAIIPNILTKNQCCSMNNGMWNTIEHLSSDWCDDFIPIDRNNSKSWKGIYRFYPIHSMLIQHYSIGHAQYAWDVRQHDGVISAFSNIWNCDNNELLVSMDGVSCGLPFEATGRGWYKGNEWFHSDQSFTQPEFKCIQGYVTANVVNEGDATLALLESSHIYHADIAAKFGLTDKSNWHKLTEEQREFYNEKGCTMKKIKCPAGSLVLWDSRTIHCGREALKTRTTPNIRNIVYVCYQPRSLSTATIRKKKINAFENMRLTSHWASQNVKLFPVNPRTYGSPLCPHTPLSPPTVNDDKKYLIGY